MKVSVRWRAFDQRLHCCTVVVQCVAVGAIWIERDRAVLASLRTSPGKRVLAGRAIAQRGAAQGVATHCVGAAVFGDVVLEALYRGLVPVPVMVMVTEPVAGSPSLSV